MDALRGILSFDRSSLGRGRLRRPPGRPTSRLQPRPPCLPPEAPPPKPRPPFPRGMKSAADREAHQACGSACWASHLGPRLKVLWNQPKGATSACRSQRRGLLEGPVRGASFSPQALSHSHSRPLSSSSLPGSQVPLRPTAGPRGAGPGDGPQRQPPPQQPPSEL